jgi:hypothetical protein
VEDDAFDITRHIKLEQMEQDVSRADLQGHMTRLAHLPLERDRPCGT